MNNLATKFGNLLRDLRRKKGFTQQELAIDSDLDRTYISKLERGERMPTILTVFKIAGVLGVSPSSIMRELEK